jgi:hypothetical protein
MDIITALGFIGLAAVVVIAIVVAWPRRRMPTIRLARRSASSGRSGSGWFSDWSAGNPVFFVGGDAGTSDCGAGGDSGSGGSDCH